MTTLVQFADPTLIVFGKLALAALLGMIIGTERATAGKGAGTRTFALVALGSCLVMVVGKEVDAQYLGIVNFDPMRIASAVVQGIGLLAAGLILFQRQEVHGMTTAAGLWVVAGLGIAVGAGMYLVAIFATTLIILVFTAVWFIENRIKMWFGYNAQSARPPVRNSEMEQNHSDDEA
jgi:putative Mg2+ transporter-C (MgtC) family protein